MAGAAENEKRQVVADWLAGHFANGTEGFDALFKHTLKSVLKVFKDRGNGEEDVGRLARLKEALEADEDRFMFVKDVEEVLHRVQIRAKRGRI